MKLKYIRQVVRMVPHSLSVAVMQKYAVKLVYFVDSESYPSSSILLSSEEPVDSRTAFLLDLELSEYITDR